ncbi:MAG TPA: GYF domain-containing protein [Polyangiaceae bacterium]
MKFLCPQCKAKYRIADEKLAQRASSRMKCRKCGHVIDIRSALVPDSVYPPGVTARTDTEDEHGGDAEEQPRKDVPRVAVGGAPPRRSGETRPAGPQAKRAAVAPPRRGGATAAAAQAVAEKTSPSIEEAAEPAPQALARSEFDEDQPTRVHDGGALTAAFSLAVGESPGAAGPQSIQEEWYIGIDGSPLGPLTIAQLREKAASGKVTLESLVWRDGFEEWKPIRDFPELSALVEEAKPGTALRAAPDPHTIPAPAVAAKSVVVSDPSDLLEQLGAKQPRKPTSHAAAWVAVLVALALGVTIGAVLLSKTEKQEVVKYVEVPASAKADPAAPGNNNTVALEESTVSGGATKRTGGNGAKMDPVAAAAPSAGKGLSGLSGLSGLNGIGPATAGPDVTNAPVPGGQLDGASIQRVVANFSPSVRRGCWDQAISSRSPDAPSSARVGVAITISSSGGVDNVTTTGDPKGYPNLAHCIEAKVRAWRFPRSSGTTTANVPFVFAVQ